MDYPFEIITPTLQDWHQIESSPDCTCFHSCEWYNYLVKHGRHPLVVKIQTETARGYFLGAKRWLGITIIESPPVSTGTYTQGLCMLSETTLEQRLNIYKSLYQWLHKHYHVKYMQVSDWRFHTVHEDYISPSEWHIPALNNRNIHFSVRSTFFVDTRNTEEVLWNNLNYKSCKYSINKAHKEGLTVQVINCAEDIPNFVDIHRRQIEDVFSRKGMTPMPYQRKEHLLSLCQSLFPDKILMLKVMGKDDNGQEQCMSSAIFCPGKAASTYFTGASFRQYMKYCPNELMVWEGMRLLHERGAGDLIFGGIAHYKKKFGTSYAYLPVLVFTPYTFLFTLRTFVKKSYGRMRNILSNR
ncbi:MAG: hypothetical protein ACSW8I_01495 [bacterium]